MPWTALLNRCLFVSAVLLFLLAGGTLVWAADDENYLDWRDPTATQMNPMPQYQQGYPYPYTPYPPQYQYAPAPQPQKRGLLAKLLFPMSKKMSKPIDMVKKVPQSQPKETESIPDPLIRLGRTIQYGDQEAAPGLYLLAVNKSESAQQDGVYLTLMRQQDIKLRVPAFGEAAPMPAEPNQGAGFGEGGKPPDPTEAEAQKTGHGGKSGSHGKRHRGEETADATPVTPPKPKLPEAEGHAELSQDGQSMILVYKRGGTRYTSMPIPVVN